jgi:hypothetical protein
VLRVISALQESRVAMAVRLLLPRHAASTPLLSSLGELARNQAAPVPQLVREVARSLVDNLPTVKQMNTAAGVKTAIQQSGLFLENKLAHSTSASGATPAPINTDYKANLVQLIQLVRNWPGSSPTMPQAGTPVIPQQPPGNVSTAPPDLMATDAAGKPVALSPPAADSGKPIAPNPVVTETGKPAAAGSATTPTPDQVQRAIRAEQSAPARPGAPAVQATAVSTTANASTATASTQSGINPPPPFPGVIPTPQASVQATLDLINRLGNLRLDLLQQTEAALARVQLSQLASLPREGERGLVEWLFDIPLRRGEDIDFWSARMLRENADQQQKPDESSSWSVQLAFDLPGLGPMQAHIQLHGERVSTHFWATDASTLPLLQENLHELRSSFNEVGLEVGNIDCRSGRMPQSDSAPANPLIDEKA